MLIPLTHLEAFVYLEDEKAKYKLTVEVACTYHQIQEGLSGRTREEIGDGMLFILQEPVEFWMMDMLTSIDIIWMNRSHIVVATKQNAKPCTSGDECESYIPYDDDFSYVLELPAGYCKRFGIAIGSDIPFEII